MKRWLHAGLLSAGIIWGGPSVAETPQFDGVYAQLEGGELVALPHVQTKLVVFAGRGDDTQLIEGPFFTVGGMDMFGWRARPADPRFMVCFGTTGIARAKIGDAAPIDLGALEAIVVRSPERHEIVGIAYLTGFEAVQTSLRERQGAEPLANPVHQNPLEAFNPAFTGLESCQGRPGEAVGQTAERPDLVRHSWGWWNFQTQTVDALVTRFYPEQRIRPPERAPDFLGQVGMWPIEGYVVEFIVGGARRSYFVGS